MQKQPRKYPIGSLICFQPATSQLPTSTSGMRKTESAVVLSVRGICSFESACIVRGRSFSFWTIRVMLWSFAANCGLSFATWLWLWHHASHGISDGQEDDGKKGKVGLRIPRCRLQADAQRRELRGGRFKHGHKKTQVWHQNLCRQMRAMQAMKTVQNP